MTESKEVVAYINKLIEYSQVTQDPFNNEQTILKEIQKRKEEIEYVNQKIKRLQEQLAEIRLGKRLSKEAKEFLKNMV